MPRPSSSRPVALGSKTARAERTGVREASAQATREALLRAAISVFAEHGFSGGRVEQIATLASSHDRMIYYYFGSKEGVFIAALGEMYRRFNAAEAQLQLDLGAPVASLDAVVRFMWHYYRRHPEFVALLNTENLHRGKHIGKLLGARDYSSPAIAVLGSVLDAGAQRGLFRPGLVARDVYLMVAGMAYFYISNRYTLSAFLGEKLTAPPALAHWEDFIADAVLRTVSAAGAPPHPGR